MGKALSRWRAWAPRRLLLRLGAAPRPGEMSVVDACGHPSGGALQEKAGESAHPGPDFAARMTE